MVQSQKTEASTPQGSDDTPVGAISLNLSGDWSVREFCLLLSRVADSYDVLARFGALCDLAGREDAAKVMDYDRVWYWVLFGFEHFRGYRSHDSGVPPRVSLEEALSSVFSLPLVVDKVRMESPGWLQVVGSLNPLKIIADFISRWRAENTKRQSNRDSVILEKERIRTQASVERERIRAQFAQEILHLMPESARWEAAALVPEVIRHVVRPAVAALEVIGDDERVGRVRIVDPGDDPGP